MIKQIKSEKKGIKKVIFKIFLVLLILCFAGIVVLGGMNAYMLLTTNNKVYSMEEFETGAVSKSSHYEACIVLGCAIWGDSPSPMLADRLRTAAMVYNTGCCDYILVTGDSLEPERYDETSVMRDFLIEEGVPSDKIVCDPLGLSTYESMYRAYNVYHLKTAVVVTTGFHVARGVYDVQGFGIDAVGVKAINSGYIIKPYNYFREFIARGKDLVYMIFKPGHDFIGSVL